MGVNAVLNATKTVLSLVFPLITFPYISRVLQVDNVGMVNFSTTFVSYFILIAGLGIQNYAVREGARLRDNADDLERFCCQVFTINVVSTVVAYVLLVLAMLAFDDFLSRYFCLIAIQSVNILGTTIGTAWFFTIIEDYAYTTVRTIVFQFVSMAAMFLFVRTANDSAAYAWILVLSTSGASIVNFLYARRFVHIQLTVHMDFRRHIKPILVLFASSAAITIYVNIDTTMLAAMVPNPDHVVGLYAAATKIYTVVKNIIAALMAVILPRLSYYVGTGSIPKYEEVSRRAAGYIELLMVPLTVGLLSMSWPVILILTGETYIEAIPTLMILAIGVFLSTAATFFTNAILLPFRKEKVILKATLVAAIANVLLNFFFIPTLQANGAAITTITSEMLVILVEFQDVRHHLHVDAGCLWDATVASLPMLALGGVVGLSRPTSIPVCIACLLFCALLYLVILNLLKNEIILSTEHRLLRKLHVHLKRDNR